MAADISTSLKDWSTTEASNSPAGSTAISTNLDDNLRQLQSTVRDVWSRTTVASAATCDIGAVDHGSITISGTTTITSFGTVSEGIRKWLTFSGALTLTHNATSLILPSGANITTAAGDVACMESLGSGNWRCLVYQRANGQNVSTTTTFPDGTVSAPGLSFTNDANTGVYRIGADNMGVSTGGTKVMDLGATNMTIGATSQTTVHSQATRVRALVGTSGSFSVVADDTLSPYYATFGNAGCELIAGTTGGNGTDVTVLAGDGIGVGNPGGSVLLMAGDSADPGNVTLRVPTGTGTPGTGYAMVTIESGTSGGIGIQLIGSKEMVTYFGTTPSISSGAGTGATISGNNNGFSITCGTSASTSIVVAFSKTAPVAPIAVANYRNATTACRVSATTTTNLTITLASAPSSGHVIDVLVFFANTRVEPL